MEFYSYSALNNAFYAGQLLVDYERAGTWPADAVLVDDIVFAEFSGPPPAGMRRVAGPDGLPVWEPIPSHIPTWDDIRAVRDRLLAQSEEAWLIEWRRHAEQLRLIELGETVELYRSPEWMAAAELEVLRYHQVLRDIPQTYTDPANVVWPEKWMQHDQST